MATLLISNSSPQRVYLPLLKSSQRQLEKLKLMNRKCRYSPTKDTDIIKKKEMKIDDPDLHGLMLNISALATFLILNFNACERLRIFNACLRLRIFNACLRLRICQCLRRLRNFNLRNLWNFNVSTFTDNQCLRRLRIFNACLRRLRLFCFSRSRSPRPDIRLFLDVATSWTQPLPFVCDVDGFCFLRLFE